jgi:alkanesulfonate monooxygenase SsuD/methylene tetrahydromethanopterin reductase-like flavin-dependent oxidoreductase (luciferase family)
VSPRRGGRSEKENPMHITLSVHGHGHHPAAWRVSGLERTPTGVPRYEALLRRAEEGGLDAVLFLPPPVGPGVLLEGRSDGLQIDTLPLIATLVPCSERIGLGGTVYMAHTQPFHTARALAVLDNLSAGRTALVVDLEGVDQQEADFAHDGALGRVAHYERCAEYLTVAGKLWDSWEDGAVVADKAAGLFADSSRIHPIHHVGAHFTVRGPLTAVRPIQGHPVVVMRDASAEGLRLAAEKADLFLADEAALIPALRAIAAAQGRPAGALKILLNISPLLAETLGAAREREAALDGMAAPSAGARFAGTPADFAGRLAAWQDETGCDGFNILPAVLPDDAEALVRAVLPLLRERGLFRGTYAGRTLREHLGLPRPASIFALQGAA